MTWTRLDFDPKDPPVPRRAKGEKPPARVQAIERARAARQVRRRDHRQAAGGDAPASAGSSAWSWSRPGRRYGQGGPRACRLSRVGGGCEARRPAYPRRQSPWKSLSSTRLAAAEIKPGESIKLVVGRGEDDNETSLTLTAGEGF